MFPIWNWTMLGISVSFHSVAILSTVFRLSYRWYTAHMWWDDAWATVALVADVPCLVITALQQPIPDNNPRLFIPGLWVVSIAYPTIMWTTRLSILTSLMHVTHPEGIMKRVVVGIGILFGMMSIGMIAQRFQLCFANSCYMDTTVLIPQTTTDCIADVLLTGLPIWSFRDMRLRRKYKTLLLTTFSASMVVNIVTVTEAVVYFQSLSSGSIVYEHVKVACSLFVCNLLVIVTFIYRTLCKGEISVEEVVPRYEFTTVELEGFSQGISQEKSMLAPSGGANSSAWSFRGGSRSNSMISTGVPRIETLSRDVS